MPLGVPVMITSPGSRVSPWEMIDMSSFTSWIMRAVLASWRSWPLSRPWIVRFVMSSSVSIQGPSGAEVSEPLARIHCPSVFWTSLAVKSLPQVYPKMNSGISSGTTSLQRCPMTEQFGFEGYFRGELRQRNWFVRSDHGGVRFHEQQGMTRVLFLFSGQMPGRQSFVPRR